MNVPSTTAAIGGTALSISLLIFAHEGDPAVERVNSAAFDAWERQITRDLGQALEAVCEAPHYQPNNAIVQIEFGLDRQGRPTDFSVWPGEANWGARSAAIEALKRLDEVGSVPLPNPLQQRFLANIVFFATQAERVRLSSELKRRESRYLATMAPEERPFILGG